MDQWIDKIIEKRQSPQMTAFISCIIAGFLTFMYTMTHHFLSYDSMWNLYSKQDMISSGRQFLTYACRISSDYDLPWVNGVLAIIYLAVSAWILVYAFEMKKHVTAALCGAFLVTFPSIAGTFCYSYTIDGYMLAVLCTTFAFFLAKKYRFGWIPAIFLTGFSLGVYQAYFSYLILLCMLTLMLDFIFESDLKEIFRRIIRYCAMGIGGYLFYVISLKIMVALRHVEMSGYQGTDKVLSFSFNTLPKGLITAFKNFFSFMIKKGVLTSNVTMRIALYVLLACAAVLFVSLIISKKTYKSPVRMLGIIALVLLLPFGTNLISIIYPSVFFYVLLRYPWVVFFVFIPVLAERVCLLKEGNVSDKGSNDLIKEIMDSAKENDDSSKISNTFAKESCDSNKESCDSAKKKAGSLFYQIVSNICIVASFVMIFEFAVMANIVAFNMNERYEKTYATCLRLVDRLEQCEGFKAGDTVAVLGGLPDESIYPFTDITYNTLKGYFVPTGNLCVESSGKFITFFNHYMNISVTAADPETEQELLNTPEYKEMNKFPKEGSIRLINDVWVIKIN